MHHGTLDSSIRAGLYRVEAVVISGLLEEATHCLDLDLNRTKNTNQI